MWTVPFVVQCIFFVWLIHNYAIPRSTHVHHTLLMHSGGVVHPHAAVSNGSGATTSTDNARFGIQVPIWFIAMGRFCKRDLAYLKINCVWMLCNLRTFNAIGFVFSASTIPFLYRNLCLALAPCWLYSRGIKTTISSGRSVQFMYVDGSCRHWFILSVYCYLSVT